MASTYDQSVLSSADQERINQLGKDWTAATQRGDKTAADSAHSAAEAIRASYGYSGGTDGSGYVPLSNTERANASLPAYTAQEIPEAQDYSEYLRNLYSSNLESALAGYEGAYKNSAAELDAAAGKIPGQYQQAQNEAAGAYQQTLRSAAEYAAAYGLNSGAAAQARLSTGNAYQNNVTSIANQEADAMVDLELQRTKLANEYQTQIAQAKADNNAQLATALYNEYIRLDDAAIQRAKDQSSLDYQEWQSIYQQYQAAQTATENLASQGWNVISQGVMPNASQLAAMGLDSATAQAYINSLNSATLEDAGWKLLASGVMPSAEQLSAMGISASQASSYLAKLVQSKYTGSGGGSSTGGDEGALGDLSLQSSNTKISQIESDYAKYYNNSYDYAVNMAGMSGDKAKSYSDSQARKALAEKYTSAEIKAAFG